MSTKIALIGLGNLLLSDEGVGVHIISEMNRCFHIPDEICLLDGGTLGLDLLPLLEGKEKVLFIDAVDFQQEPGSMGIIEDVNLPSFLEPKLSLHHVGLSDLLFASSFQGNKPAKIVLIGIQPERVEVGLNLSETLCKKVPLVLKLIVKKLQEWGIELKAKNLEDSFLVSGHPLGNY